MMIRPATAADVEQWFGRVPASMRAIVAEDADGNTVGIAGISAMPDRLEAFAEIKDSIRAHPVTMARAAAAFKQMLAAAPTHVMARCSTVERTAPRLLSWLGFKECENRWWRYG